MQKYEKMQLSKGIPSDSRARNIGRKTMKKRILILMLVLLMVVSLVPTAIGFYP